MRCLEQPTVSVSLDSSGDVCIAEYVVGLEELDHHQQAIIWLKQNASEVLTQHKRAESLQFDLEDIPRDASPEQLERYADIFLKRANSEKHKLH